MYKYLCRKNKVLGYICGSYSSFTYRSLRNSLSNLQSGYTSLYSYCTLQCLIHRLLTSQCPGNKFLRVLNDRWDTYLDLPPQWLLRLKKHCRIEERQNARIGEFRKKLWNVAFWIQLDYCTHEHTSAVVTCTRWSHLKTGFLLRLPTESSLIAVVLLAVDNCWGCQNNVSLRKYPLYPHLCTYEQH